MFFFFFSSRRRHTRLTCDWSSDVCSSDLAVWTYETPKAGVAEIASHLAFYPDKVEIGRASCRESVDLGGRRIIKKKKKKKKKKEKEKTRNKKDNIKEKITEQKKQ